MRNGISIVFLSFLLVACASTAPKKESPAVADEPFISRSIVFFPDHVPGFELSEKYKYPDPAAGVQITYRSITLPGARLDFFVYAIGRVSKDEALKEGMNDIRQGIEAAQSHNMYKDVKLGAETDIDVPSGDGSRLTGRKLTLSFLKGSDSNLSAGYMFYKQLYLVELRISAPESSGTALGQTGDQAVTEIVQKIHILSEGGCEKMTVHVPEDATKSQVVTAVKDGVKLRIGEGCPPMHHNPEDWKPADGEDAEIVTYPGAG